MTDKQAFHISKLIVVIPLFVLLIYVQSTIPREFWFSTLYWKVAALFGLADIIYHTATRKYRSDG